MILKGPLVQKDGISYFLCSTRKRVRATKEIEVRRLHADNSYDDDNLAVVQVKIIN